MYRSIKLDVRNEFSPLESVLVGYGKSMLGFNEYTSEDPEFHKFHSFENGWDKELLISQQQQFFKLLQNYGVHLHYAKIKDGLHWQMFTRDTGFVYHDTFYFCSNRKFSNRNGEVKAMADTLIQIHHDKIVPIHSGFIEGGDVLVTEEEVYVGISSRTNEEAVRQLEKHIPVKSFYLGGKVMHLDTRMTILPRNNILICPTAFQWDDLKYLKQRFNFIAVSEEEAKDLATNVFCINPETIVVHSKHQRIQFELQERGFNIESINTLDYSEPIELGGSFRCTTLPLRRRY